MNKHLFLQTRIALQSARSLYYVNNIRVVFHYCSHLTVGNMSTDINNALCGGGSLGGGVGCVIVDDRGLPGAMIVSYLS